MEQPPENIDDDEILSLLGISKEETVKYTSKKNSSHENNSRQQQVEEKDNCEQLQRAADYFIITKTIKSPATYIFGSSFGLIIVGIVLLFQSHRIAALYPIFLAVPVLVVSLFALLRPSAKGLFLQGIVLILGGILLFFIGISSMVSWYTAYENSPIRADRPDLNPITFGYFLAGFFAILWGIIHFSQYARFRNIKTVEKPAGNNLDLVRKIANNIDSANPKTSTDIIEFVVQTFWGKQIWKGRLSEDSAVFVLTGIEDIIFSRKEHTWITKIEGATSSEKALIRLRTRTFDGSISNTCLERYKQWKEGYKNEHPVQEKIG